MVYIREAHPEEGYDRLYLIGQDRRIAFQGGEGPFGFKPEELARAIERLD